jgi:hypothetical protein
MLANAKEQTTAFFHKYLVAESADASPYQVHPLVHGGQMVRASPTVT